MTTNDKQTDRQAFDTSHPFAFLSGFLILPALSGLVFFILSVFIVMATNPTQLEGYHLMTYFAHALFIPYLIISFYYWVKRKRFVPILMSIFFLIQALWSVGYMIYGVENEFMNVAVNTVWFIYFIRSKRVKATFVK